MNAPIAHHVIAVIARYAAIDAASVSPGATLAELGIVPCRAIEVTFAIEDAFDINVPLGACDLCTDTVGVMIAAVGAAMHPAFAARSVTVEASGPSPGQTECDSWWYAEWAQPVYAAPVSLTNR